MISDSYEPQSNPLLGIIHFVRSVRERKIIPILCVVIFCLAGLTYYVVTPRVYEPRAVVLLNGRNKRDVRLLTSEPVLSNVAQELAGEKIPELETLPHSMWVSHLRKHLSVKSPAGRPDILNLEYASRDPQAATAILNKLVTVYVSYLNHNLYETVDMINYKFRLHRLLSKDVSILLGNAPQSSIQPTNREDSRSEKSPDVQSNLAIFELPSNRTTLEENARSGSKEFKQNTEPIFEVTLKLNESQQELDDAANRNDQSSNTSSLSGTATQRQNALQQVILNLEKLKNTHFIKDTVILSRATVPVEPASPLKLTTILPVLVFLGFGLGLGIIYVVNAVDDRFYSPGELSHRLSLPILEIIKNRTHIVRFLTQTTLRSHSLKEVVCKEFEALRVTLSLLREKSNVLVISSVDSKSGKTTLSLGLANAFAQSGKRTLLIDCDYQNGKLSRVFSDDDQAGLSRILSENIPFSASAEENILCSDDRGLEFLPRGNTNDSPTNFLTKKRFSEFLSWCETRYDQIVIDAPAALASSDATILGKAADGIILVINPAVTTQRRAVRTLRNLNTLGCRLIGIVANQLEPHSPWLTIEGYGYLGIDSQLILQQPESQAVNVSNSWDGISFSEAYEEDSGVMGPNGDSLMNKSRVA